LSTRQPIKSLRFGEASDLLGKAKDNAVRFVSEIKDFDRSRKHCQADRAD
jgi:hypothetical protein